MRLECILQVQPPPQPFLDSPNEDDDDDVDVLVDQRTEGDSGGDKTATLLPLLTLLLPVSPPNGNSLQACSLSLALALPSGAGALQPLSS
jgi:hypothetical protein